MSDVKWIRLTLSMFNDEKIRLIEQMPDADTILMIWIKLLVQAGKINASGSIFLNENIPYTDEMLATIFDRPISTVRLALETFKQFGMISIDENSVIYINNWEKHQNVEGLEKIREQNRIRQAKFRKNKKIETHKPNNDKGNEPSNVTVTLRNATELELEEELEEDIDKERDINNNHVRDLFDHYLSKNIIQHRKITSAIRTAINARLKDYSFEELKKALDNYAFVLHSDDHWFTHKYPLADFMRDKDVRKFLDEADPLNNFKNKARPGKWQNTNNDKEIVPDWFKDRKPKERKQPNEPVGNIDEILNQFKNAKG